MVDLYITNMQLFTSQYINQGFYQLFILILSATHSLQKICSKKIM